MKSFINKGLLTIVCLLCMTGLYGCGKAEEERIVPEYVFTYSENQAKDYPTTLGAYRFAELVSQRTSGRIEIRIYPESTLSDEPSAIEQMQFGGIDFTRASISTMGNYVPKLNVLQLPYLYKDADHMWRVLDGKLGQEFMEAFEDSDMVALSWYDAGARSFYTSQKPITCLEDMRGMRIRIQKSDLMEGMIEALGAIPVPTGYEEVYSSLETGAIDGAENNWPSYESAGHYKVAKYLTVDEHTRVPELQLISRATWEKLSADDQKIIMECAQESAKYERQLWAEREEVSRKKVLKAGTQIIDLSIREKDEFQKAVSPLYQEFCGEYMDLIEAIIEVGDEHGEETAP